MELSLEDNNDVSGKSNGSNHQGTWTMIYDEGFEITFSDYKFFSFSKYESTGIEFESICD